MSWVRLVIVFRNVILNVVWRSLRCTLSERANSARVSPFPTSRWPPRRRGSQQHRTRWVRLSARRRAARRCCGRPSTCCTAWSLRSRRLPRLARALTRPRRRLGQTRSPPKTRPPFYARRWGWSALASARLSASKSLRPCEATRPRPQTSSCSGLPRCANAPAACTRLALVSVIRFPPLSARARRPLRSSLRPRHPHRALCRSARACGLPLAPTPAEARPHLRAHQAPRPPRHALCP